jgi:hypothetical protein
MRGTRNLDDFGVGRVDPGQFLHELGGNGEHVADVAQRVRAFEQHELEMVAEEGGSRGDFHVATVIADAAGQGEPGSPGFAVHADVELSEAMGKLRQACGPVGSFAELGLERRAYVEDDLRVQTDAGHQDKISGASVPRQFS